MEPASFGEVLASVAEWCTGKRVAFLTGGRLMDEDYYALSKLARTVFGTNDIDHRRIDGVGEVEQLVAAEPMSVTYRDVENAQAIIVVGLDAEQEIADPAPAPAQGGAPRREHLGRAPARHAPARRGHARPLPAGR